MKNSMEPLFEEIVQKSILSLWERGGGVDVIKREDIPKNWTPEVFRRLLANTPKVRGLSLFVFQSPIHPYDCVKTEVQCYLDRKGEPHVKAYFFVDTSRNHIEFSKGPGEKIDAYRTLRGLHILQKFLNADGFSDLAFSDPATWPLEMLMTITSVDGHVLASFAKNNPHSYGVSGMGSSRFDHNRNLLWYTPVGPLIRNVSSVEHEDLFASFSVAEIRYRDLISFFGLGPPDNSGDFWDSRVQAKLLRKLLAKKRSFEREN